MDELKDNYYMPDVSGKEDEVVPYRPRMIKDMEASERPREKALEYGIDSLNNIELLAIIFATGIKDKSVIDLCKEILEDNDGHLSLVAKLSVDEVVKAYKGIGKVKAITLLAALKLGERTQEDAAAIYASSPMASSEIAYKYMKGKFQWKQHEEFWVMYLNRAGRVIRSIMISQGGTAATTVDIKIILRHALKYSAEGLILFHNHPSGNLRPSREDDHLTERISKAARTMDLKVYDHIIVTDTGFYSYNDNGRIS